MPIINKGTSFSNGEQLTADKINNLLDLATFNQSATDSASTTVNSASQIVVADSGISTSKIKDANVTFAKLTDVIDDDTMGTATADTLATSESIKAYTDSRAADPERVYNSLTHSTVSANIQQNTTGRPLWVSFTLFSSNNIDEFRAKISSNSDMSSSTQIGQSKIASDGELDSAAQLTMIVPDQWYWQFIHTSTSETQMVHSSFIL